VTEEPEKQLEEMEERSKEVEREIEQTEQQWESTKQDVPNAEPGESKPVDEDNPVGGP
jgi:hypothetical protein